MRAGDGERQRRIARRRLELEVAALIGERHTRRHVGPTREPELGDRGIRLPCGVAKHVGIFIIGIDHCRAARR